MIKLAEMADVSKPTMIKAISRLREKGLVNGGPRRRIRVGAPTSEQMPDCPKRSPWQIKREVVERDIVSGVFGFGGKLPSIKELQARYGYCFTTMKKILEAMADDGSISLRGKGYALADLSIRSHGQRIVFVTILGHFSQRSALNHEHNRIVNLFENECKRLGLLLDMVEIDFYDSLATRLAITRLTDDELVLGYFVDGWIYLQETVQQSYRDLLTRLASFRMPIAVLDEIGDFVLPIELRSNPLVQVYGIEGVRAGERVARYLAGLGHASVVYLSFMHFAQWSIDRFEGIASQFARMGYRGKVHLVSTTYGIALQKILAASSLTDGEIRAIIAMGRTPSQAKDLEAAWIAAKSATAAEEPMAPLDEVIEQSLSLLSTIIGRRPDVEIANAISGAALAAIGQRSFKMELEPLFEHALTIGNATAWVCANDGMAIQALSFLRSRNISVPRDISVVGFDNSPVEALEQRLTTLDFNALGFVQQMANFIVRPPRPRGPYHHRKIEVEGIILERETTGRAGTSVTVA